MARGGAHTCWGPRVVGSGGSDAAPGPLTQASAPKAPGRLGRAGARIVGAAALSPEQAAAAHAGPQGAFLIAAGPGTGKTFTATERFCWLVEQGVAPDRILTVTFSDRAAEELRRRITLELTARRPDLGPNALDGAWIGTFHSVCARLLDEFAYLVGAPREMRVLDETGQRLFEQRGRAEAVPQRGLDFRLAFHQRIRRRSHCFGCEAAAFLTLAWFCRQVGFTALEISPHFPYAVAASSYFFKFSRDKPWT